MFLLNGRMNDDIWDEHFIESESQNVMVVDSRRIRYPDRHGLGNDGNRNHEWDELLVITIEGEFFWVTMDDVTWKPMEERHVSFGPILPDLPSIN